MGNTQTRMSRAEIAQRRRKAKKKVRMQMTVIAGIMIFIWVVVYIIGFAIGSGRSEKKLRIQKLKQENYFSLQDAMTAADYKKEKQTTYTKTDSGVDITVFWDFDADVCTKNDYSFNIRGTYEKIGNTYYVSGNTLNEVLNYSYTYDGKKMICDPDTESTSDWYKTNTPIAHAGGAYRDSKQVSSYTNSYEAMIQNYDLGHRVFEYDFYLTSDKKLACVHDWIDFGYGDGTVLSSKEWKNFASQGKEKSSTTFTTMMVDDVMDQMVINKDMYLITDTKATDFSDEDATLEFQLLYDAAVERNPELLNRIVPQIYNNEMYDMVESVYHFPNIIYTTYATDLSGEEIIAFVNEKDNINIITNSKNDDRFSKKMIKQIHKSGKYFYKHTVNDYALYTSLKGTGVDGIYTDQLLPSDTSVYDNLSVASAEK